MSADQELAATGGSSIIGFLLAGVALVVAGATMAWRKAAHRSASHTSN